jgi:enoyl-CoA hydratase
MDMILTGRPVEAIEAKQIGLVNRLAPAGHALAVALELAKQLASFPQAGLRNDRLSAISQWGLPYDEAVKNELRYGQATVRSGETAGGAARFSRGEGRHGRF